MPPHLEDHALPAYVYQPEVPRSHDFHRVLDLSVGLLANGPSFRRPVSVLFSGLLLLLVALVDQELNVVLMDLRLLDGVKCIFPSLIAHELPECSSTGLELASPVVLKVVNHQSLQMVLTPCSSLPELELFTSFASITSVEEVGDLPVCLLLLVVSSLVWERAYVSSVLRESRLVWWVRLHVWAVRLVVSAGQMERLYVRSV